MADNNLPPIIVKKIKKVAGGHHGGSWKVAYADFVTAMMAFFLLMWLLATASTPVKQALAFYFTKFSIFKDGSGVMPQPVLPKKSNTPPPPEEEKTKEKTPGLGKSSQNGTSAKDAAQKQLQQMIDMKLSQYKDQIEVTSTPEGVRVNISDKSGQPMFMSGGAQFADWTGEVMKSIAEELKKIPNPIAIEGHTDAVPFAGANGTTNWELSTQRAMQARRALEYFGVPPERYAKVIGYADKQLQYPENPTDPKNRRISFIVQFQDDYASTPTADGLPHMEEPGTPTEGEAPAHEGH